jgi:methylmalonyl-CoA mutase N-terminal domain/subunit
MEFAPKDADRDAAWELYIELLTRITTQKLEPEHGDEKTALDSVYNLFALTRGTLRNQGRMSGEFAKIAIVMLNQVVRPFTAKWHKLSIAGAFDDEQQCRQFRNELSELQAKLRTYTKMLADMAGVEDLTALEPE